MDTYVELINKTNKTFLIERSAQGYRTFIVKFKFPTFATSYAGGDTPTNLSYCPYNFFRSSGDIRNSWNSIMHNLGTRLWLVCEKVV